MHVLVNGLSVRSLSGQHVLLGHLRQLAQWTLGRHTFLLLHDCTQTDWVCELPQNVKPLQIPHSLASWYRRLLWETVALPRLLRNAKVDIVFTTSGTVLPGCRLPQVCLAQNPWCLVPEVVKTFLDAQKAALQRRAYRRAVRQATLMCYNSRHMQDLYRQNAGGAQENACRIVYQGIDEEVHRQAAGPLGSTAKDRGLIVSVSAMAAWKGAETLVEALAILRRSGSPARLRLVGPWPDRRYEMQIRAQVSRLGLEPCVTITGQVSKAELHRHCAEAGVFCLMSQCESFGIPAVEAQAFGTPVVGSSTCAMPEICGDGGLYCPPGDPAQTAALLGKLLEDSTIWQDLSDRARANAARFRWQSCSQPLLEMFGSREPVSRDRFPISVLSS